MIFRIFKNKIKNYSKKLIYIIITGMTTKCPSNSLASRRGVNLPELQFCLNYDSKNTPPQIQHKLIINEFPYWVNYATHWLLWFNLNYNLNIKEKTEEIVNKYFPDKEVVMYENNESNKTIKEIRHTHIFVKN